MTNAVSLAQMGGVSPSWRNRIINGDMRIDQRNAGASVTPDSVYTLDRWQAQNTQTGKFTVQQNAGSVTPPTGFTNYLGVTSTSAYSVTSTDWFNICQPIEGFNCADLAWGTANAQTVTLSFWVRSSLTGTFGGAIVGASNSRSYPFSYTISSANTWTQISITIAGDTTGSWVTNNTTGMVVRFSLGAGSTRSGTAGAWASGLYISATGATSVVGTNGATFYITGVQLEKGSTATSFDYRPYGTELALCQRYFYKHVSGTGLAIGTITYYTGSNLEVYVPFPVTMRAIPTLYQTTGSGYYVAYRSGGTNLISSFRTDGPHPQGMGIYNNTEASGTSGSSGYIYTGSSASYIGFQAEL